MANLELLDPDGQQFGRCRFRAATIVPPARDRPLVVLPRCRAWMGDPHALDGFGRSCEYPVYKWSDYLRGTAEMEELLRVECPVGGMGGRI
eukprot:8735368-Pyramimonas_sp.AAC.1